MIRREPKPQTFAIFLLTIGLIISAIIIDPVSIVYIVIAWILGCWFGIFAQD